MDWTLFSVIVLSTFALLPVYLFLRLVTLRGREQQDAFDREPVLPPADVNEVGVDPLETPSWSSTGASASRLSRTQQEVSPKLKRIARLPQQTDSVVGMPLYVFDYTIRRQAGAARHALPNLGGFTRVPFVLRDRLGNSVTVHRRLCLN